MNILASVPTRAARTIIRGEPAQAPARAGAWAWAVLASLVAWLGAAPSAQAQQAFESVVADEIFYHIMPIAWRDSNSDAQRFGDFDGLTASLDHLQALGITAVWLNPIFPSAAYHGYQHGPADQIDADFGTQAQFLNFVNAARARGIKVYLDFVAYGISHNSTYYQSASGNSASQYDSWLAFTNDQNTQYLGSIYNTWNGSPVGFIHWDLRNPDTRTLVTNWARKWLDPNNDGVANDGIAGYRFDHCWVQYGSGPDGWGYNLDDFWTPFFASLRSLKPDSFMFGEQADWGTRGAEFLSQFDAMFTMPFQFAARNGLASENVSPIASEMDGLVATAQTLTRGTFLANIGNHDVDRLATVIGADSPQTIGKAKAAAAVLLLQPFAPVIYFGDELAMTGWKQNYGSDANDIPMREPYKWKAIAGFPMSNYFVANAQAYNNRFSRNNDGRSVEEQQGVPGSVLETYRSLIALRKAQPALRRGTYTGITAQDTRVWSFLRRRPNGTVFGQNLLVAVNLSGSAISTTVSLSGYTLPQGGSPVTDIVSLQTLATLTAANQLAYPITIEPYGYRVLSLSVTPPPPAPSRVDGRDIPTTLSGALIDVVQTSPTTLGNNAGELNRLMVKFENDGVLIGLPGNLSPGVANLALFIDSNAAGTTSIWTYDQFPPPGGLSDLTFTAFDEGFTPETMFFVNAYSSNFYVDQLTLSEGSSAKTYRGSGVINSGTGLLSGGTNPGGIQVALDNRNTDGVTGSSAAGAASATRGFEIFIPYGELGLTAPFCGRLLVSAFLSTGDGRVSSQCLPSVPGLVGDLGYSPFFPGYAGDQFADSGRAPSCPPLCTGDANSSRSVDFDDITEVLAFFGGVYTPQTGRGDANHDGSVNFDDLTAALSSFGSSCP